MTETILRPAEPKKRARVLLVPIILTKRLDGIFTGRVKRIRLVGDIIYQKPVVFKWRRK